MANQGKLFLNKINSNLDLAYIAVRSLILSNACVRAFSEVHGREILRLVTGLLCQ